jgi:hypothetical protein
METEVSAPVVAQPTEAQQPATTEQTAAPQQDAAPAESTAPAEPPKREKTDAEREVSRLRRRVDNLTRRLYQGETKQGLQQEPIGGTNQPEQSDTESLSLSRRQLQELIDKEARRIAPTISRQEATIEHRRAVVERLASDLGAEKFDALAADLDDALDGLKDSSGKPKPAAEAIFEADNPTALVEYLADPENAADAKKLANASPFQAGRLIAKIEDKLEAKKAKPQPSKAAAPIEPIKGGGAITRPLMEMDGAEFDKRRREMIAARGR